MRVRPVALPCHVPMASHQAGADVLEREVDDHRRPARDGRRRARVPVVGGDRAAERHVHVRVGVDEARHQEAPADVDASRRRRPARVVPTAAIRPPRTATSARKDASAVTTVPPRRFRSVTANPLSEQGNLPDAALRGTGEDARDRPVAPRLVEDPAQAGVDQGHVGLQPPEAGDDARRDPSPAVVVWTTRSTTHTARSTAAMRRASSTTSRVPGRARRPSGSCRTRTIEGAPDGDATTGRHRPGGLGPRARLHGHEPGVQPRAGPGGDDRIAADGRRPRRHLLRHGRRSTARTRTRSSSAKRWRPSATRS